MGKGLNGEKGRVERQGVGIIKMYYTWLLASKE